MAQKSKHKQYVNVQHSHIIINLSLTVDTPLIYIY